LRDAGIPIAPAVVTIEALAKELMH
jgi:hypothetical protein